MPRIILFSLILASLLHSELAVFVEARPRRLAQHNKLVIVPPPPAADLFSDLRGEIMTKEEKIRQLEKLYNEQLRITNELKVEVARLETLLQDRKAKTLVYVD